MDAKETLKLLDAGFTADEIREMLQPKDAESDNKSKDDTGANEKAAPEVDKTLLELSKTVAELKDTVKSMQDNNANNARTNKPGIDDKIQETIKSFTDTL